MIDFKFKVFGEPKLDKTANQDVKKNFDKNEWELEKARNKEKRLQDNHDITIEIAKKTITYAKVTTIVLLSIIGLSMISLEWELGLKFILRMQSLPVSVQITLLTTFFAHIVGLYIVAIKKFGFNVKSN
jgi:hypothetical protein